MKIYYNIELKSFARKLRKQGILSEVLLWEQLKNKKLSGFQFSRQKPIGNYIVDFYCNKLNLVIEIDGITHDWKIEKDKVRQFELEKLGLTVLRVTDSEVRNNINGVVEFISEWIKSNNPLTPFFKGE